MSKGVTKINAIGTAGDVIHQTVPNWSFIYEVSKIKHPNYNIGDVVELPNGKGFVYCKSSGACYTGRGNVFDNAIPATGIDYANNIAEAAAIGAYKVKVTNGSTVVQTKDGLRGGTIILKPVTDSSDAVLQMRGIVGNDAMGLAEAGYIYLDAPLSAALTTSSYSFCMPSPYSAIKYSEGSDALNKSHVGIAATYVSASGYYHWEQFKGRCWLAPQEECGQTAYGREVVWRYDGSVQLRDYSSASGGACGQVAGYILDDNTALNGSTEIMLTGNV